MIRNLNQASFQSFGTILPERSYSVGGFDDSARISLQLFPGNAPVYRAISETCLTCGSGRTVLSVCAQSENWYHFHLEKTVCVKPGVTFALTPFQGTASVEMTAEKPPEVIGSREKSSLRIGHGFRVEGLYTLLCQELEQGFLFPGEAHPTPKLTYVDQGSLHSVAGGQDILLKQGDMVIYGPGQWHMQYADIGTAPRIITISFDLAGGDLKILQNRKITVSQSIASMLQQMLREQEQMDAYSDDLILSQLTQMLLLLLRQAAAPYETKPENAIHSENEIICKAQVYISSHIRQKLSVPMVARQIEVSPSYLTALFHKHLQISPGEYIRRIKLQESKQMIREDRLNFTEIAAALQYSTVHHFSRQFKEKFGITPTEYAKSVR